eukprot:GEMP01020582.1.p1 GENE.GEMP01020582.1~~GEMP01020582.1.p1  ORF type:complete len:471 (+),score=137.18 GEMP01020582.1:48-1415(+)
MAEHTGNVDAEPLDSPIGNLRIRINRPVNPAESWMIDGELVHFEVVPDGTVTLILLPAYNLPNADEATRRAIASHPAKSLVVLPLLRDLHKDMAEVRTSHLECEFRLNFITAELEEDLARLKKLVEDLRTQLKNAAPAPVEPPATSVDAELLVELVELRKGLEESRKLEDRWRLDHRKMEESRKHEARKLDEVQAQLSDARLKEEDMEKELTRLKEYKADTDDRMRRELDRKEEDFEERLAVEREKHEGIVNQFMKRLSDNKKNHEAEQTLLNKQLKLQQKKTDDVTASLKLKTAQQQLVEDQKRSRDSTNSADTPKEKKKRPNIPPPHVLRRPPPPPPQHDALRHRRSYVSGSSSATQSSSSARSAPTPTPAKQPQASAKQTMTAPPPPSQLNSTSNDTDRSSTRQMPPPELPARQRKPPAPPPPSTLLHPRKAPKTGGSRVDERISSALGSFR